jgi:O-antigen/teichoic acid export membrane protein
MSHSRRSGSTLALNQIVSEGCAFLRNLLLARLLGAEQMGWAITLALTLRLFEMLGDFGWDRLLVQARGEDLAALRRTIHGLQLMKAAGQTILYLLSLPLLTWIFPNLSITALGLIALSLLVRGATNYDYRERQRDHAFGPALVVEGGSNLIALIAVAPVAWLTRDHAALAWAMLIQAFCHVLLSHAVAQHRYSVGYHRRAAVRCVRYGIPIALNGLLMFAAIQGDRFVIALNFTAADFAAFAIAAQLALLPALVGARLILAFELPRFARWLTRPDYLETRYRSHLHQVALVAAGLSVLLGVLSMPLIELLYGEEYIPDGALLWLLAAAAGLRLVRALPSTLLMAKEKTAILPGTNVPRLLALLLVWWLAVQGAELTLIVAVGVLGEAIGLAIALSAAGRALRSSNPSPTDCSLQGAH